MSHGKVHSPMTADIIKRTSRLELRILFLLELPMHQSDITDWHRDEIDRLKRAIIFSKTVYGCSLPASSFPSYSNGSLPSRAKGLMTITASHEDAT
jgi:hypothetical protein